MNKIKYIHQRIFRGYDDRAIIKPVVYFAPMLCKIIFDMSENVIVCPFGVKNTKEWKQILKEISFGFGSIVELNYGCFNEDKEEIKRLEKDINKGLKLFAKYYKDLWN